MFDTSIIEVLGTSIQIRPFIHISEAFYIVAFDTCFFSIVKSTDNFSTNNVAAAYFYKVLFFFVSCVFKVAR